MLCRVTQDRRAILESSYKMLSTGGGCCCSVAQLWPALCDHMECSMPDFLVLHHLTEIVKCICTELVMWSNHLILCRPLLLLPSTMPSMRVFSNESALPIRWLKYWSFTSASVLPRNIQGWFPLGFTGLISVQSKGLSRVFHNITVQKHRFFGAQPSLWSNSHIKND